MDSPRIALIIGAGSGLSAAIARKCVTEGITPLLAARDTAKLDDLIEETGGAAFACDAGSAADIDRLFDWMLTGYGVPELVVFNPTPRVRGPFVELDRDAVAGALAVTAYGGFLAAQAAARAMLPRGSGSIIFTGASASVKGYAQSAPFAMCKFALRGLAQSMARELSPQGIHVGHVVIDGGIGASDPDNPDRLHPDDLAEHYLQLHRQPRSAWSLEIEVRPFLEKF